QAGNDVIVGGLGADIMAGGAGQDTFEFVRGDGADTVTDFSAVDDRISAYGFSSYQLQQVGADTIVTFAPYNTVRLTNVDANSLSSANFDLHPSLPQPSSGPYAPPPAGLQTTFLTGVDYHIDPGEVINAFGIGTVFVDAAPFLVIDQVVNDGTLYASG